MNGPEMYVLPRDAFKDSLQAALAERIVIADCRLCGFERVFRFAKRMSNGSWFMASCGHVKWVDA